MPRGYPKKHKVTAKQAKKLLAKATTSARKAHARKTTTLKRPSKKLGQAFVEAGVEIGKLKILFPKEDAINPNYYLSLDGKMQVADIIERFGFDNNWHRAEAIRSLMRAGRKNIATTHEDLKKAIWYIERELKLKSPR